MTTQRKSLVRAADTALRQDEKARGQATRLSGQGVLDSFTNFAQKMGVGSDNPLTSGGYGFNPITRNRMMLEWIHRGSWLGGVAVDVVADDMTRAGIQLKTKLEPEKIDQINEEAVRLMVWQGINDMLKWDRLYGGALGIMLIDGQDQSTPLRMSTIRKGQFCGILAMDRWMVEPSLNDLVQAFGPHLGLPKYYRITANAPALNGQRIHYTRVIRMAGVRMPYWQRLTENLWGTSVLERLYDRMIAFDSATTGASQLVYKSYLRTYKVDGLREVVAAGGKPLEGLVAYVDMMRRFQGIEGITLLDGKDEFEAHTHGAFSGLSDALVQFGQQLSGALQIPLVRLFGQSPAGFNTGEADLRNYYDMIKQKQESELRIPMTTVYRLLALSSGIEVPDGFRVEFPSLWQMTDEQKAIIASTTVDAVTKAEEAGLISQKTAMKELQQSSERTGIFTNITEQDLNQAEEVLPPSAEEAMGGEASGENPPVPGQEPKANAEDAAGSFEESEHPRDPSGKFSPAGASGSSKVDIANPKVFEALREEAVNLMRKAPDAKTAGTKWRAGFEITQAIESRSHNTHALRSEGKLVGAISWKKGKEKNTLHISHLGSVIQGGGTRLMDIVESIAAKEGKKITLYADPKAKPFYEKRGYQVSGPALRGTSNVLMEKTPSDQQKQ